MGPGSSRRSVPQQSVPRLRCNLVTVIANLADQSGRVAPHQDGEQNTTPRWLPTSLPAPIKARGRSSAGAIAVAACVCVILPGCHSAPRLPRVGPRQVEAGRKPAMSSPVDPSTLERKFMFGYQGWFGCPADGSPLNRWQHWFAAGRPPAAATLRVDMWPDVSDLPPDELCDDTAHSPVRREGTALIPRTTRGPSTATSGGCRSHALAGAFLQRFTLGLRDPPVSTFRDTVARNVRSAAEANGRVFAIMYDISGHPRDTVVADIERDWVHLVDALRLTRQSAVPPSSRPSAGGDLGARFRGSVAHAAAGRGSHRVLQEPSRPALPRDGDGRRAGAVAHAQPGLANRSGLGDSLSLVRHPQPMDRRPISRYGDGRPVLRGAGAPGSCRGAPPSNRLPAGCFSRVLVAQHAPGHVAEPDTPCAAAGSSGTRWNAPSRAAAP